MKRMTRLQMKLTQTLIRVALITAFVAGAGQAFADQNGLATKLETTGEMTDMTKYLLLGGILILFIGLAIFVQKLSERD